MPMLTKIAQSQDHRYVCQHLYLALKQRRERSQAPLCCQSAIFALAHPLTAFFPWSWQLLQVLHSMHCHHRALTRAVSSGENLRQDGWPAGRETRIHKQVRQRHRPFFCGCWLTAVTHLHHCRKKKKSSFWNWKPSLNQTWLQRECSNINDNLSELCFRCLKSSKQDGLVWDRNPLRGEEEHNLSSAFTKQQENHNYIPISLDK